jgi:hypothetical protein
MPTEPAAGSLTPEKMAELLQASGAEHVTAAAVQADIAAGAPTNADGTLNLIAYTAWLVHEVARGA